MNYSALLASALALALLGNANCYRQVVRKAPTPAAAVEASAVDAADKAALTHRSVVGNDCPKTAPWPCKNGQCLSFAFICDGRADCSDGYDEDKALCTAKDRPASIILMMFITRFQKWLIPNVLGRGTPEQLSKLLTEERNVSDYAKKVGLSKQQLQTLVRTMEFAREGRVLDLIMEGMPEEAYREAYALFGRIVESGFLGSEAM